jgi:hypothetical protein
MLSLSSKKRYFPSRRQQQQHDRFVLVIQRGAASLRLRLAGGGRDRGRAAQRVVERLTRENARCASASRRILAASTLRRSCAHLRLRLRSAAMASLSSRQRDRRDDIFFDMRNDQLQV